MKSIRVTLAKGSYTQTLVDDEDYSLISKRALFLSKNGYARTHIYVDGKRKKELVHRIIMRPAKGEWIDHINFDKLDNRRTNLRIVTPSENCRKRRKSKIKGNSRFKGVHFCNTKKRFKAIIKLSLGYKYLGSFREERAAAGAYNKAAIENYGEFAVLNELD